MFGFLKRARSITEIALDPPAPQPGRAGLALVLIVRGGGLFSLDRLIGHRLG